MTVQEQEFYSVINNQKVYFVTVTVDYQQIIEKQEFNGLELCTGLPQFPVLKQEEKGGK